MSDRNGYLSSDFKRNTAKNDNDEHDGEGEENSNLNEKAGEYLRDLLSEKIKIDQSKLPISLRLVDQEVTRIQSTGRLPAASSKYVDVFRDKPVKVVVKVLVPIKEHPKFNFVGKILGPKGHTMKQLQEETMCKMAVLGRGSMRDRQKEEELRNSVDPKYAHLTDELHVEISALAPPAEAHARIAYALAEIKKYLTPDPSDMPMQRPPMRDMMERGPRGPPPPRMPPMHPMQSTSRAPMGKSKVISILDRARSAMDPSYYDDPYGGPEQQVRGPPRVAPEPDYYGYERPDRFYEDDYYKQEDQRDYKATSREVGTRRSAPVPPQRQQHFQPRASPYARPPQKHHMTGGGMGGKKPPQRR